MIISADNIAKTRMYAKERLAAKRDRNTTKIVASFVCFVSFSLEVLEKMSVKDTA